MLIRRLIVRCFGAPQGEAAREMDRVDTALMSGALIAIAALIQQQMSAIDASATAQPLLGGLLTMMLNVGRSPLTWYLAAAGLATTILESWICHRVTRGRHDVARWKVALKSLAGAGYAACVGAGMAFLVFAVLVPDRRLGFVVVGCAYIGIAYMLTYTVGRALDQATLW